MSIGAILSTVTKRQGARAAMLVLAAAMLLDTPCGVAAGPAHHPDALGGDRPDAAAEPAAPRPCAEAGALGTARVAAIGTEGGLAVGLKTYPRSLVLADHEIVLTFDDGPLPATTPAILDALARQCVQATFFLVGRNAAAHSALVRREIAAGHTVGHHSFSHPAATLRGLPDEAARRDILAGIEADETAAGFGPAPDGPPHVPFFRFPGFADTRPLVAWLGGRGIGVFSTDIWASDWNRMTPDAERELLLGRIEKARKGIVLLHDIKAQTAAMLPGLLTELKRRGYHIVHLVPGPGEAPTDPAPAQWTSQTEAILAHAAPRGPKPRPAALPRPPGGPASHAS